MPNRISTFDVLNTVKNVYLSDNNLELLMDFERVLSFVDLYVYENWEIGELVKGPEHSKYFITFTFMWPYRLMPNPLGAKRLLDYGVKIKVWSTELVSPKKNLQSAPNEAGSVRHGVNTFQNKTELVLQKVWMVEFKVPRSLMVDIEKGYVELQGENIDLSDVEHAETQNIEQGSFSPSPPPNQQMPPDEFQI